MAFFSNMPRKFSSFVIVLLLFSPPFTQNTKNLALADQKLIQSLCQNSETPETCMKCVLSSKGDAEKSDSIGIATIVVNCMMDKAITLEGIMNKSSGSAMNPNLKNAMKRCANDFGYRVVQKKLVSSKEALKNHKFDEAESSVVNALAFDLSCHKELIKYQQVPYTVFYHMFVYEELSEAACRIIEKL